MFPFSFMGGGSSIDPDAQAYITASGITDPTLISSLNFLFKSLKGIDTSYNPSATDLYTRIPCFWVLIGGDATKTKLNCKNPVDSDAANRLAYSGGWTFSTNGAKGNGTNSYADTFIPRNTLSINTHSFGFYFRENTKRNEVQMGFYNTTTFRSSELGVAYLSSSKALNGSASGQVFSTNTYTDINGFNRLNRTSNSTYKIFRNGVLFETISATGIADANTNTFVLGGERQSGGSVASYSNKTFCYADFLADATFSDAETLVYYNIVQQFLTLMGVQV